MLTLFIHELFEFLLELYAVYLTYFEGVLAHYFKQSTNRLHNGTMVLTDVLKIWNKVQNVPINTNTGITALDLVTYRQPFRSTLHPSLG